MDPNTNPSDKTQQNLLQIPEFSFSEIFTGQIPNPSLELQQQICEIFPSEQTQT